MKKKTFDALTQLAIQVNYIAYCSVEKDEGRTPLDKETWLQKVATGEISISTMVVH